MPLPIPEPFTAAALTAGVLTNLASDILKHHAQAVEGTLVGRILKRAGFIEPNFDERLRDTVAQALKLYYERHPQYQLTGILAFFRDESVAQQIGAFILDREPIDETRVQQALTEHLGADAIARTLMQQRGLDPLRIVPDFLECYRETLTQALSVPQMAILLEVFDQTDTLITEIRASEQRIMEFVAEKFKTLSPEAVPENSSKQPKKGDRPIVAMDVRHGIRIDSHFARTLEVHGFETRELATSLTASSLFNVNTLILFASHPDHVSQSLTQAEITAIQSYVVHGGGLFLIGLGWWWKDSGGNMDDYPLNRICHPQFGIYFKGEYLDDPKSEFEMRESGGHPYPCIKFDSTSMREHPVTVGIHKIFGFGMSSTLQVTSPAIPLVWDGNDPNRCILAAWHVQGQGRVVCLQLERYFRTQHISEFDNLQLLINTLAWLSQSGSALEQSSISEPGEGFLSTTAIRDPLTCDQVAPFLITDGSDVWLVEKGTRKHVPNNSTLRHLRKRYGFTVHKSHQEIQKYIEGPHTPSLEPQICRDEEKRCYLITTETKREIKDARIIDYLADGQTPISIASKSLASLEDLPALPPDSGKRMVNSPFYRVRANEEREVFLLKAPFIRYIPNPDISEDLAEHLELGHVRLVPVKELDAYIEGPPISNQTFKNLKKDVNTAALRDLLTAAFSDEELATLCYDHFRPVYEQFSSEMSKPQKIQRLVEHCERHRSCDQLLALVRERNPAQFAHFEAQLGI